ncbi:PDDEXK family nuclease [Brevibacterium atlanticum]|uniref:restriction endonuclease FokI C-terminal domain-containing protein n=1 Tax=Brevibacterium atlanticum TaxID=2697563 RepID=UPI00141F1058|nr:restriction endonuclease FokI C-terminal domain-containing protein [Brevibacterium atlanticum]
MASKNYWMFTRPQRKLYRLPLTVAALHEAAGHTEWSGNRERHIAFEDVLEREGIKRRGQRRDNSGSGGRTHATLVRSLGLAFDSAETGRLELTLAGLALAEGTRPTEILKHQVMRFQYPSTYSVSRHVDISDRFRLRPFVLLLRLLLHPRLGGYVTQDEVALVVIVEGTGDSPKDADRIAELIQDYRENDIDEEIYVEKYGKNGDTYNSLQKKFSDVANTAFNWLEMVGVIERAKRSIFIPSDAADEAQSILDLYGTYRPIRHEFDADRFQRSYGLPPGKTKDTRNLAQTRTVTQSEFVARRVTTVLTRWSATELLVDGATSDIISRLVAETGYEYSEVEVAAKKVLGTDRTLDSFLSNYQSLVFSDDKSAPRYFERATAEIFRRIFNLEAECVGQSGREPDVVVTKRDAWRGIVDTKAYSGEYSLPSEHERAMREYVETYRAVPGAPLSFWVFIAGSISKGAKHRVRGLADRVDSPGSVIGMLAWTEMIRLAQDGKIDADRMAELFKSNSELTLDDVRRLPKADV